MSHPSPPPIAIVGGGPGGLMLASLLQTAGIEHVVFDRDISATPTSKFLGGTLDIHAETGQVALRRAGLSEKFEALARRDATTMRIQDSLGQNRVSFGEGRDAPEIDRLQLRQLLLDSIPASRIQWNKALVAAERDGGQQHPGAGNVLLHFADGSTQSGFRLIVGADGARSKVRRLITSAEPKYTGKMFIEGKISLDNPQYNAALEMVGAGLTLSASGKTSLVVQQTSDRTYRVYMGVQGPETMTRAGGDIDLADTEKARVVVLERFFKDWSPALRAIIEDCEGPWRAWPWCNLDPDLLWSTSDGQRNGTQPTWERSAGVTLLGDAAHAASPNGEGVNIALQDALVLFECILAEIAGESRPTGDWDVEADSAALERVCVAYEADMRPRGRKTIEEGIKSEKMIFSGISVEQTFREMGISAKMENN
ncbi:FAD binding domain-containing protein [Penicillium capsulatum]|uniref:FAD binding domain-containing protein n=1 Tax=Penicillium capsulatum TaxID=69766 RepID=A0A9W9INT2_9EURO|nr:FAD binding domain-containing protein [Penicillium capsulatum]KAJ6121572.1 FAD binding domain-containing protein [Penicillium capsulatum]